MFGIKMTHEKPTIVNMAGVVPIALCEKQTEITIAVTWRKRYHH